MCPVTSCLAVWPRGHASAAWPMAPCHAALRPTGPCGLAVQMPVFIMPLLPGQSPACELNTRPARSPIEQPTAQLRDCTRTPQPHPTQPAGALRVHGHCGYIWTPATPIAASLVECYPGSGLEDLGRGAHGGTCGALTTLRRRPHTQVEYKCNIY